MEIVTFFLVGKVKQVGTCLQKKKTNHIILRKKLLRRFIEIKCLKN
jgi:hypothetical protein